MAKNDELIGALKIELDDLRMILMLANLSAAYIGFTDAKDAVRAEDARLTLLSANQVLTADFMKRLIAMS